MEAKLVFYTFNSSIRDHDHCDFCWEKFSEHSGDLHEGYFALVSAVSYRLIRDGNKLKAYWELYEIY